jgi:hypothetical protein
MQPLLMSRIVAIAMAAATIAYLVVGVALIETPNEAPPPGARDAVFVLLGAGLLAAIAMPFLRSMLLTRSGGHPHGFVIVTLVTFGLLEWTSLCGLVATLLDRDPRWVIIATAVSLPGMALAWPRRATFEAFTEAGRIA